jgi:hypothetical protein
VSWLGITIRFGHRGRLGTYSAKLLNGTRQRFSGFSQLRQCGDDVLRMLVTGGPPVRGGGGMPQRISASQCFAMCSRSAQGLTGCAQLRA